jgi:hypothetical protein
MTCANVILTVLTAVVFLIGVWPRWDVPASPWIAGAACILMLVTTWTMVDCKACKKLK